MRRRLGRFYVSREMVDDNLGKYIYEGMVPVRVELDFSTGNFAVIAMSDKFDDVNPGQIVPFYQLIIESDMVNEYDGEGNLIGGHSDNYRVRFERADAPFSERGFGI